MQAKTLSLSAVMFSLCACVSAQTSETPKAKACPADVEAIFTSIVGEWTLSIEADEGWTGYGSSRISWDADQKCGVVEQSRSVFNQESEDPAQNQSTTYLVYDELTETIKVLTSDTRGYVHIGIAAVDTPLNFEVLKPASETPTRRIQYRNIEPGAFEWSWQGRSAVPEMWKDRLVINYDKVL